MIRGAWWTYNRNQNGLWSGCGLLVGGGGGGGGGGRGERIMIGRLLNSITFTLGPRAMKRKREMFTFGASNHAAALKLCG